MYIKSATKSDPDPVPFRAVDPDQVLFRAVDPVPHGTAFIFLPGPESRRENWKKLKKTENKFKEISNSYK